MRFLLKRLFSALSGGGVFGMSEIKRLPFCRLPKTVVPKHYAIELKPNLKNFKFNGRVVIDAEVCQETDEILINCAEIQISRASFNDVQSSQITYQEEDETVRIKYPNKLAIGHGKLTIDYVGTLNDKMKGFYRTVFRNLDGTERYAAVTQFESTDARRALPCWDEPAVKATFDVSLIVPKDKVALSNMNVINEVPLEKAGTKLEIDSEAEKVTDLKKVTYATTPKMSTYLLAFVVGDFDYVEATSADGVLVRVYTPVGKKEQGSFALDVAVKTLPFYKDYFGIAYPLPKVDLVAIADFAAGAMENWGLITYREAALLIDPVNSSSAAKQWVAIVVGHELAHQWFGNLVTMEWWTHLWLNEGFASWIEYLSVNHCFPEWDIWTQFIVNDFARALTLDALKNSHPIEVPVGHPSEVDEIFDAISYQKGSSIIAMLNNFVGEEVFRKGLNHYLNKFMYSNAVTEDLWDSLELSCDQPVREIMRTWTEQMGYPVLSVSARQSGRSTVLEISQSKFSADEPVDSSSDYEWIVPIVIASYANRDNPIKVLLDKESISVILNDVGQNDWIKVNYGQFGFYRVRYSPEMLQALVPAITELTLNPRDRLGVQNDAFALTKTGLIPTADYLNFLCSYKCENNYTVWSDIMENFDSTLSLMEYANLGDSFKRMGIDLLSDVAVRLGWDAKPEENHTDVLLRSLVLAHLGKFGDSGTVVEAKARFAAFLTDSSAICPDLRSAVYKTVLSAGDDATFNALLELVEKTDLQEEKMRIITALGAVKQEALMKSALEFALSDKVRYQDKVFIMESVARGSKTGRQITWNFVKDHWEEINNVYTGGFLLSRLIKSTLSDFAEKEFSCDIREFFDSHDVPAAERTIEQVIESIDLNINWLNRDASSTKSWLESKKYYIS